MKIGTSNPYQVSNNFRRTRSGSKRAVAAKDAEKSTKTTTVGTEAPEANDEAKLAKSGDGTPAQKPKRRDVKGTPATHATTKATEMANLKGNAEEPKDDPIAGITSGTGGSTSNQAPVDRDELASSSKVLFGDEKGGKKKVDPRKSYKDFPTEDDALEAAINEAERQRKEEAEALAETEGKVEVEEEAEEKVEGAEAGGHGVDDDRHGRHQDGPRPCLRFVTF